MSKNDLSKALGKRTEATPEPKTRFHTTLYLDKEFYGRVKIALIEEGADRDFNKLVNELLREWYEAKVKTR